MTLKTLATGGKVWDFRYPTLRHVSKLERFFKTAGMVFIALMIPVVTAFLGIMVYMLLLAVVGAAS